MLKDVTLGQYFPGDTVVHRLDPRTKLILVIVYIVALMLVKTFREEELLMLPKGNNIVTILAKLHLLR